MIASDKNMPVNGMESSCRPSPISNDALRCDMNSKVPISIFLVAGFLMVSAPLFAHHGNAAYDDKAPVTIKGIVTDYLWVNPHVQVVLDVKNDQGEIVHWACETVSPSKLFRSGWTRDSLRQAIRSRSRHSRPKATRLSGIYVKLYWRTEKSWGPWSRRNENTPKNSLSIHSPNWDAGSGSNISNRQFRPNGCSEVNTGEGQESGPTLRTRLVRHV